MKVRVLIFHLKLNKFIELGALLTKFKKILYTSNTKNFVLILLCVVPGEQKRIARGCWAKYFQLVIKL